MDWEEKKTVLLDVECLFFALAVENNGVEIQKSLMIVSVCVVMTFHVYVESGNSFNRGDVSHTDCIWGETRQARSIYTKTELTNKFTFAFQERYKLLVEEERDSESHIYISADAKCAAFVDFLFAVLVYTWRFSFYTFYVHPAHSIRQ